MYFNFKTWIAFSVSFSGILHGNENDEDCGFVETQPGFVDGQGLIFLQHQKIAQSQKFRLKTTKPYKPKHPHLIPESGDKKEPFEEHMNSN